VIDEHGVDHRLGQREQRVDPGVARGAGLDARLPVERAALLAGEHARAVEHAPDVTVAVHLEDVAELLVDHQPAHRPLRRVLELEDARRVAAVLDQLLQRQLDRQLLHRRLLVDGERVVHVEADELDLVHLEVAVDEHAAPARDVGLARDGEQLGHGRMERGRLRVGRHETARS
jgi:hypothetical protein